MRIAHCVEGYLPAIGGMVEVVRQLSERMVRSGHEVTVYTSHHADRTREVINGVRIREFALGGNAVRGIIGDPQPYLDSLIAGDHDVVVFFAAHQWATDLAFPHLSRIPGKKVFVPTGFSGLSSVGWKGYFAQMPGWMTAMDLNIFHSEGYQDVRFAEAHGITKRILIPNGAAEEEFGAPTKGGLRASLGLRADQPLILHVGSYTGIKGHKEAMRIFLKARTGDAALLFIGNGVSVLHRYFRTHWRLLLLRLLFLISGKKVFFREFDRTATVEAMKQADLFLFPSQVECSPIVLFETMAAGVPFLASKAGNAEEIAQWSSGGWTIDSPRDDRALVHIDIGAATDELGKRLSDRDLLKRTGAAGQAAWRERFTWRAIAERYVAAYEQLLVRP